MLRELGLGQGEEAFFDFVSRVPEMPELELVNDGFMLVYGDFATIHVFEFCGRIMAGRETPFQSVTAEIYEQRQATMLFLRVMRQLLAA
ncbi:hypothetical protein GF391_02200 [Candidatus Uhrbacteria bacterium]|nr:hypothetical protein [Candidatus Uhrbacteria bacterium]